MISWDSNQIQMHRSLFRPAHIQPSIFPSMLLSAPPVRCMCPKVISQGTIHLNAADSSLIMRNGTFARLLVTPRKVHRTHLIRALLAGVVLSGANVGFLRQYCATIDSCCALFARVL